MKILMQNRLDMFLSPGGDTIQVLKTKEYLEKIGCKVEVCCDLNLDLRKYDIVHLFNITRMHETYMQYLNAKKQNKPVILSPVYQNFDELDQKASTGLKKYLWKLCGKNTRESIKTIIRAIHDPKQTSSALKQLLVGFTTQQKEIILGSNRLLPNSNLEAIAIRNDFGIEFEFDVVPYSVDHIFTKQVIASSEDIGFKDYVLCVGNYIERKNQLALIEAMRGLNIPLVLIGAIIPTHKSYYKKTLKQAASADFPVKVLGKISQFELVPFYINAKVVALPSWIETCGMAGLEGALSDCNVVITNRGHSKEYFENMAYYCDPSDVESIRKAIVKAYSSDTNRNLKEHVFSNFTWEKTAEITKRAYEKVLSSV